MSKVKPIQTKDINVASRDSIEYSFAHCVERFSERYNGTLTRAKYDSYNSEAQKFITSDFKSPGTYSMELISRDIGTIVTTYTIKLKDDGDIFVSFEKERNRITTLFPPKNLKTVISTPIKKTKSK